VWLRGRIRAGAGEWCCEVVGSCEVRLSFEVRCSSSSQPHKNVCVCVCAADSMDSSVKQFVSGDESHLMNGDGPSAGQFSHV